VEENVLVRVLSRNESVTAVVVEEINCSVCHCEQTYSLPGDNTSEGRGTTAPSVARDGDRFGLSPEVIDQVVTLDVDEVVAPGVGSRGGR